MESQDQEVEAFQKWWRENGKVVVIGVVAGLSAVIGWNWWLAQEQLKAEVASSMYSEVVNAANDAQHAQALSRAKAVMEEFPDSGYAALSALVGARSAHLANAADEAKGQLQWVIANAKTPQLQDLARVRLARVLIAEGKTNEAGAQLDGVAGASFDALVAELRGDLSVAAKETDQAVASYQEALAFEELDFGSRQRLELKLNDLGVDAQAQ